MSVKISLGKKKKSFNSIMEAAKLIAAQTGEPVSRVYIRIYMRMRAGKPVGSALQRKPRQYVRKMVEQPQMEAM